MSRPPHDATPSPGPLGDWPRWTGHRGAGRSAPDNRAAPENTLAALNCAAAAGFQAVEVDVRLAADGVPIILHDETLARTAGRSESVATLAAATLAALPAVQGFAGPLGLFPAADLAVPSLRALLDRCRALDLRVNLELKADPADTGGLVEAVADVIADLPPAWAIGRLLLSSFDPALMAQAHARLPAIRRALLCEQATEAELALAGGLGCSALNVADATCSPAVIQAARARGLAVLVWTVNAEARALALLADGARSVITDRIAFAAL